MTKRNIRTRLDNPDDRRTPNNAHDRPSRVVFRLRKSPQFPLNLWVSIGHVTTAGSASGSARSGCRRRGPRRHEQPAPTHSLYVGDCLQETDDGPQIARDVLAECPRPLVTALSQPGANAAEQWGTRWEHSHWSERCQSHCAPVENTPYPTGGQVVAGSNPVSPTREVGFELQYQVLVPRSWFSFSHLGPRLRA
jgi:hypothetical protein